MKLFRILIATLLAGTVAAVSAQQTQTTGPAGEPATLSEEITLTEAEALEIREGDYTAALVWHTSSDFVNAVTQASI
jgi:ribose transport system substrate-binding protein